MKLKKFHTIIQETPQDTKDEIKFSLDVLERINELLNKKFEGKQHLLAQALGKSDAEVSKWLNGVQNFTFKTILKLQKAFGENIIAVCTNDESNIYYEQVKSSFREDKVQLVVNEEGCIKENFHSIKKSNVQSSNLNTDLPA